MLNSGTLNVFTWAKFRKRSSSMDKNWSVQGKIEKPEVFIIELWKFIWVLWSFPWWFLIIRLLIKKFVKTEIFSSFQLYVYGSIHNCLSRRSSEPLAVTLLTFLSQIIYLTCAQIAILLWRSLERGLAKRLPIALHSHTYVSVAH